MLPSLSENETSGHAVEDVDPWGGNSGSGQIVSLGNKAPLIQK